jgi:hypothetical protein
MDKILWLRKGYAKGILEFQMKHNLNMYSLILLEQRLFK